MFRRLLTIASSVSEPIIIFSASERLEWGFVLTIRSANMESLDAYFFKLKGISAYEIFMGIEQSTMS